MPRQDGPQRSVVTSFLTCGSEILILRRSDDVGTYSGKWAGVSGYLDRPDPRRQAEVEIQEELGLGPENLRLLMEASPLLVLDRELGIEWTLYPFLFEIEESTKSQIGLDREHTELRWIEPRSLVGLPTVPSLREAFESLLPCPSHSITTRLRIAQLAGDRVRGAREIASLGLDLADDLLAKPTGSRAQLLEVLDYCGKCRPGMAPLVNSMGRISRALLDVPESAPWSRIQRTGRENIKREIEQLSGSGLRAATRGAARLEASRVCVTLSRSSTLLLLFEIAARSKTVVENLEVRILHSLPLGEGRATEESLQALGYKTRLDPDSALYFTLGGADLVLLGADSLLHDGSVLNKIGSRPLARAAWDLGIPVVVVAEENKRVASSVNPSDLLAEFVPTEIASTRGGEVAPSVPLLERVPADLISEIISDEGES